MADIQYWRYTIRPDDRSLGWCVCIIASDGIVSVISDYGNWNYWWTHIGVPDIRQFFSGLDHDYLMRKFDPEQHVDLDATLVAVKRRILELRRSGELTKDGAREEWDIAENELSANPVEADAAVDRWARETKLEEYWEIIQTDFESGLRWFIKKQWPLLKEAVRADWKDAVAKAGGEAVRGTDGEADR